MLGYLLKYFAATKDGEERTTLEEALLFAGGITLASGINALTFNQAVFGAFHLGGKMRIAACSLVYRKVSFSKKSSEKSGENFNSKRHLISQLIFDLKK